jgi:hypothetical protein
MFAYLNFAKGGRNIARLTSAPTGSLPAKNGGVCFYIEQNN